jgi:GNAT superfamily N-acetyltransferase
VSARVEADRVRVRSATEADIAVLAEHRVALRIDEHGLPLELRQPARDATVATYAELIATGEFLAWIGERDDAVAGSVCAWLRRMLPIEDGRRPLDARVQAMYIVPAHRRSGLGTALMNALLDAMRELGVRRVYLHPSDAGRRFYPAFGFLPSEEMELILASRESL